MGRRLAVAVVLKYSLFTGAEQHGNAQLAALAFQKAAYLNSWRAAGTAPCQGRRQTESRKNNRENSNLRTAVQSPRTEEGKEASKSKGQIK